MIQKISVLGSLSGALLSGLILLFSSLSASAFEKMTGCLVASQNCEAFRSIKKKTNPGHIRLEPGISYPLKGKNKSAATHYQVRIDALRVPDRWVKVSCGKVVERCEASGDKRDAGTGKRRYDKKKWSKGKGKSYSGKRAKGNGHYLFAVSWEPAFCETHRRKAECKIMTADSFDANNLSLHGLWPQPRNNAYCNVTDLQKSLDRRHKWNMLKPLAIKPKTMASLKKVMPGVMSNLQRHEWVKHGSCYKNGDPDTYYQDSITLMNQLNASGVKDVFANNIGKAVTASAIRAAFDKAFGEGSGSKVNVRCGRKGRLISELWINLKGPIDASRKFSDLLKKAKTARLSCEGGRIDAAGYN